MKIIIVDSCVWNSVFYKRDDHREKGIRFFKWLTNQKDVKICINDYIISETFSFIKRKTKVNREQIEKIINLLLNDERIEVFYTSKENFDLALDIYKKYEKLSLVDSIIVLNYLNIKPICLLSYDKGFDSYGDIIRLEDPKNIDGMFG